MANQVKNPDFCQTPLKNAVLDQDLPSNPVTGQFYFDGTSLRMWNGTVWKYASDSAHTHDYVPTAGGMITGRTLIAVDSGGNGYCDGQLELRCSSASGTNVSLGFHRSGSNAVALVLGADNILNLRNHVGSLAGFSAGAIWSDGVKVVDSYTNANGQCTKWSDGTMLQSGKIPDMAIAANVDLDISVAFIDQFYSITSFIASGFPNTTWTGFSCAASGLHQTAPLGNGLVHFKNGATAQAIVRGTWQAHGSWKA